MIKTTLRKENKVQRNFKKFHNFSEIFYCGMTRLRNTNLNVFMKCQYTRTILTNKNMTQSLFKKHSKFQKFDEILCCGIARYINVKSLLQETDSLETLAVLTEIFMLCWNLPSGPKHRGWLQKKNIAFPEGNKQILC